MKRIFSISIALALAATACGSNVGDVQTQLDGAAAKIFPGDCIQATGERVTIYSGRSEDLLKPVLDAFECSTGIATATNFGDPTALALTMVEEGDRTPADVFLSKSPGAVGFLRNEGLLAPLSDDVVELVDSQNRASDRRWVGITGRQRVLVYNVDLVAEQDLPPSILDLTAAKYRGKVAIPANNGSFLDWFTMFRAQEGDETAIEWLDAMVANEAIVTESNRPTVDAVGRGEIEFGLVNHYYNFQEAAALGDAHRALNYTFAGDDIGSLVIITAAGITDSSENTADAEALLRFMLSQGAQEYFTNDTLEYPLAAGVEPADILPPLDRDGSNFDLNFDTLGDGLARTVEIIEASGINR